MLSLSAVRTCCTINMGHGLAEDEVPRDRCLRDHRLSEFGEGEALFVAEERGCDLAYAGQVPVRVRGQGAVGASSIAAAPDRAALLPWRPVGHCHSDADLNVRSGCGDPMTSLCFRSHRFPAAIIQHAIWLYLRFTLSYRDVEELLAERGLDVSYKTVRRWVLKFGPPAGPPAAAAATTAGQPVAP